MMRYGRFAALAALMLAGCAPRPGAGNDAPPIPTGGMGGEFRDSHHARLQGTVTNAAGAPLDSVEVVTLRLADRSRGSLAQHRARTDAAGRFLLPVGLIAPGGTDTATVEVVVRATAFPPRYPRPSGDGFYGAEIVVPVRVVPASRAPEVIPIRLVVPVP
jgi:hypothetical protein